MKFLSLFLILMSQMAFAGPGRMDSSAFNDIIQDNQKSERTLQKELQKSAGIEVPKAADMGKISAENRVIESTVEQVTAKTSKFISRSETATYQDESDTMRRVSQEVKEAFGN